MSKRTSRSAPTSSQVALPVSLRLSHGKRSASAESSFSHPLDTIKVRMQLSKSRKAKGVGRVCEVITHHSSNRSDSSRQDDRLPSVRPLWVYTKAWEQSLVELCQRWQSVSPVLRVSGYPVDSADWQCTKAGFAGRTENSVLAQHFWVCSRYTTESDLSRAGSWCHRGCGCCDPNGGREDSASSPATYATK